MEGTVAKILISDTVVAIVIVKLETLNFKHTHRRVHVRQRGSSSDNTHTRRFCHIILKYRDLCCDAFISCPFLRCHSKRFPYRLSSMGRVIGVAECARSLRKTRHGNVFDNIADFQAFWKYRIKYYTELCVWTHTVLVVQFYCFQVKR